MSLAMVADTNILFTFFWKDSFTKKLILNKSLVLISPELALEEINKYRDEIILKTKISENEFISFRRELALLIGFISIEKYSDLFPKVLELNPIDKNDIDFIALSLKLNLPLWSNDKALKKLEFIKVYSTFELIALLNK